MQCLRATSAILAVAHSYSVVSSFKYEGKNSCHDLIPNPRIDADKIHEYGHILYSAAIHK